MILLLDNYDSFTFNLYQYLRELGADVDVVRNDQITVDEVVSRVERGEIERVVLSPGPCTPTEAGICVPLVGALAGRVPILGVCLGLQSIGVAFGGRVVRAPSLMHGKTSMVHHRGDGVFHDLPSPFEAIRYHSLIVDRDSLPASLEVTAETPDGLIMGFRHVELPIEGVQFHPESIMTKPGKHLLANFLAGSAAEQTARHVPLGY